ncbi:hypothetical protein PLICRDRAFT_107420 [Plicaturopsis crispa FD-325 SS-3]|nr:hypothetical protein PLICRDRAFT_107420 [Plicaturopsis crispa FD-325 SS-3]
MTTSALFQPAQVGELTLAHRVVLAPLTRLRASDDGVPSELAAEYYTQRARTPGSLLISEATIISSQAGGVPNTPGIYNDEQIAAWKKITDAVHAQRAYIYLQIFAIGRGADLQWLADRGHPLVSSSDLPLTGKTVAPHPLTVPEIQQYVADHATAAANAITAGFDGVEVHLANGYLVDQFLQDNANKRTDAYGGSVENRARFPLEIVAAVVKAIGASKTGVRISPWSRYQDMCMQDPKPTFSYLVRELRAAHPTLAYVHAVEPRIDGAVDRQEPVSAEESNDFVREAWAPLPLIVAGGYDRASGIKAAERGELVAYGRLFISNPDLPYRLAHDLPLTKPNRSTFYRAPGGDARIGYTDYAFAEATVASS